MKEMKGTCEYIKPKKLPINNDGNTKVELKAIHYH
jgi:hypothetical protein